MFDSRTLRIPPSLKAELQLMFLAKHALAGGRPDAEDGSHAVYHHVLLATLQAIGLDVDNERTHLIAEGLRDAPVARGGIAIGRAATARW